MINLDKWFPEHIWKELPEEDRKRIATSYYRVLPLIILLGAGLLFLSYIGKSWIFPSEDWTVLEFGRIEQGPAGTTSCRLGEIVLTSIKAPGTIGGEVVKKVAGYANVNEKYWIASKTNTNSIAILGQDGTVQVFGLSDADTQFYRLVRLERKNGETLERRHHYLRKMYRPAILLGGKVFNDEYLMKKTCDNFQSRQDYS